MRMRLADALAGKRNNLDGLRLLAACAVVYHHASPITGRPMTDVVAVLTHNHDASGSLAVKFFFFVSGLVVTNSVIEGRSLADWALSRVFRIVPAYAMALILSAAIIVPVFADHGVHILETGAPYRYVLKNLVALLGKGMIFHIDGVFSGFPYPSVNGSIWTLPSEAKLYFWLGVTALLGLFSSRRVATLVLVAVASAEAMSPGVTHILHADAAPFVPFFALGSILALWKTRVPLRGDLCVLLWMGTIGAQFLFGGAPVYAIAVFYSLLVLSAQPWFVRLKPRRDISYGTYLYGWPVQMTVYGFAPSLSISLHIACSLLGALICGWLSWMWVERRAMALNTHLAAVIARHSQESTVSPPIPDGLARAVNPTEPEPRPSAD